MLAVHQQPLLLPPAQRGEGLVEAAPLVERIEPLHQCRLGEEVDVVGRSGVLTGQIAGDHSAQHDAGLGRQASEHGVQNGPAHVVEVDVDSLGAVRLQRRGQVVLAVVDARVEPEILHHRAALVRTAGDTHHPRSGDLGDLTGHRAGGAGGRGDDDRLPGAGASDARHAEVRGGAGRSVDRHHRTLVDPIARAGHGRREQVVTHDRVLLEAGQCRHDVADSVGVTACFDDFADTGSADDLAEPDRRQVAGLIIQPRPGGGVDPDVGGAYQRLTVGRTRCRRGHQLGVTGLDQAPGTAAQQDLAIRQRRHQPNLRHRGRPTKCFWPRVHAHDQNAASGRSISSVSTASTMVRSAVSGGSMFAVKNAAVAILPS